MMGKLEDDRLSLPRWESVYQKGDVVKVAWGTFLSSRTIIYLLNIPVGEHRE